MKQLLLKAWLARGWLACLLWPLAQFHGLLVRLRRAGYARGWLASERFGVPVVVVGNVVAGGAGKTPLVMALVKHLQARGLQPGVISRGYGRTGRESRVSRQASKSLLSQSKEYRQFADDATLEVTLDTPVQASGDEPALIRRTTGAPVFVAARRADALRALLAAYPATDVVLCDDGLQHYALARNIEIAVFDDRGVGNGWLLPAGPLREPWPERQRHGIHLVLHTGQQPAFDGFSSRRQLAEYAFAADGRRVALDSLRGQPLTALAGIASPEAFFAMLRACGLTLDKTLALPDHHDFSPNELSPYAGRTVLCTEKDAIKLFALPCPDGVQLLAVPLEFSPEVAFFTAFDALLRPLLSPLPFNHGHQIT